MRKRICKMCGQTFDCPTGSTSYLCQPCRQKSRKNSVLRLRTCKICGTSFVGYPRSFFCPTCSEERKKQQSKKYNKKNPSRPCGSIDICKVCGNEYVVNSGTQKYCSECSKQQITDNIRQHKIQYAASRKEIQSNLKKETLGKRYICKVCGKEFEKHTARVTCSEECEKELLRLKRNLSDFKRGKRKLAPEEHYDSGLPRSGVSGVTWRRNGKWQATYKRKYLGVFSTVLEAEEAINNYKQKLNNI